MGKFRHLLLLIFLFRVAPDRKNKTTSNHKEPKGANMQVPSGREFDRADLDIVRRMGEVGLVEHRDEPFRLVSGVESHVYVNGRQDLTDHPDLVWKVGRKLAEVVYGETHGHIWAQCLIGVPVVGRTFAQAASMASVQLRGESPERLLPISFRVMREQKKQHGGHQKWIEGDCNFSHRYWLVDNVATNGENKLKAAVRAEEDGYPSCQMPCLIWIDRQQGAVPRLQAAGFEKVVVVYNLLDLTFAFSEMSLWPKSAVAAVEEEIKAHQFI